jgi:hypothetical protein
VSCCPVSDDYACCTTARPLIASRSATPVSDPSLPGPSTRPRPRTNTSEAYTACLRVLYVSTSTSLTRPRHHLTMATTFSTATAIPQHAPYQHHAYRKSTHSQYSPTGSGVNTPANVSPTSPRNTHLPLARHQGIYQPRTAIGIPAALRKTEKPSSKSPPKVDSGLSSPNQSWSAGAYGWVANEGSATPASHIGNEDMQSLYSAEPLSPVAGPITRNHWQVCIAAFPTCSLCRC